MYILSMDLGLLCLSNDIILSLSISSLFIFSLSFVFRNFSKSLNSEKTNCVFNMYKYQMSHYINVHM